jgi:serine/threonine-protein kinase
MGQVFRAEDTELRRTVALKFIHEKTPSNPRINARLRREARTASALNHPNICTIYEVGEDSGEVFIAMEYIEGRPLSELIRDPGLPLGTVLRYGKQIASALEHAHDRGVIHGDLKPLNIILNAMGDAKILDFGLARRADPAEFDKQTLEPLSADDILGAGGTLPYMAPEQVDGGDASVRTDLWSLGVLLYEMATGKRPFQGNNFYQLSNNICREAPPALPSRIPAGLAAVIGRCLEKEPSRRYKRAGEIRAALEALEPSERLGVVAPDAVHSRTWRIPLAVIGLLTITVAGVLVVRGPLLKNSARAGTVPGAILLSVLPPVSNGDTAQAAFESGLADTLNSRLSELSARHSVSVIPMNLTLEKHVTTIDAARQQFGVNVVLVLNVQRAAEDLRVNYSLVDARSRQQVRSGTVTAAASNPFLLQDRVFQNIAESMDLQLAPAEKSSASIGGTTEPAAYDFYVQGKGYLQDFVVPEKVDNAITLFQRALEKDHAYAAATAGLGQAYWRKYQLTHDAHWADAAVESCQRSSQLGPALAEAQSCLGRVNAGRGEYEQAVQHYKRAIELEPTNDEAHGGLASTYEQLGKFKEAEQAYEQAIAIRPGYWATYNLLGLYYMRHGRYEDAAGKYAQVVALAPDSFVGYSNLGGVRILQGQYAQAVPLLEQSLKIRPTGDARSNLGTAYFQMRRYGEAASNFEDAVKMDQKNYVLWGNLGDAYYWAPGRRGEAAAAYATAIALGEERLRLDARDGQLLSSLGIYHAMRGETKAAKKNVEAALRLQPNSPDALLDAGIAYQQLGETELSLNQLEKAVALGISPQLLADTPNFDGLRDNPRFSRLLARIANK